MKQLLVNLSSILMLLVLSFGCTHTNELAKYDVAGSKIIYKNIVKPEARLITIEQKSTTKKSDKEDEKSSTEKAILDVLSSVGSDILASDKQKKLENAINTEEMLGGISNQLSDAIYTYLEVSEVESISDGPDYICNLYLDQCKLIVTQTDVSVYVEATGSIIQKSTGEIAWENKEIKTTQIKSGNSKDKTDDQSLDNVLTALQLSSLDPEVVNKIVIGAADDIGIQMAETLREDVADAHKEREEQKNKK